MHCRVYVLIDFCLEYIVFRYLVMAWPNLCNSVLKISSYFFYYYFLQTNITVQFGQLNFAWPKHRQYYRNLQSQKVGDSLQKGRNDSSHRSMMDEKSAVNDSTVTLLHCHIGFSSLITFYEDNILLNADISFQNLKLCSSL